ncbi:MAG: DUF3426 domain-containing protein [Acidobacteria bacterium]|nr:DUF3426 domain-containing protein [Acidobacteriota bacterium]
MANSILKRSTREQGAVGVLLLLIIGFLVFAGVSIWLVQQYVARHPQPSALTLEAKSYVRNLALSDVEIKAAESYVKQTVVEISGKITNNGTRKVEQIEIYCIFGDAYGQVVLRERLPIVKRITGGLKPGETKSFRLPFDNIPPSWNQALPQLVIAHIEFT